ncbi:MAG TPA: MurR/RpiR family transcriptional regulator [Oleiagrimonas sp.]|nr:MurR/RpiR family transcriptional regulator [Oleiagrimonas sp.]
MNGKLQKKLNNHWDTFTASEQKIATYLLDNMRGIPFETAASLARNVGVSSMTVGRFLRNLGYAGVGELKQELRGDAEWLKLYKRPEPSAEVDEADGNLQADVRALTDVHGLLQRDEWAPIVHLLASADRVSVASFQQGRFLGLGFASLLQYVRSNVSFADGVDGAYTDMLLDSTERSCVVLIDVQRYSRHFRLLAEETASRGIPLAIITDAHCYWARKLTGHVLTLPTRTERVWHSFADFTSLFSLLVGAVSREKGDVYGRIGDINQLREKFIGYAGPSRPGRGKTRK